MVQGAGNLLVAEGIGQVASGAAAAGGRAVSRGTGVNNPVPATLARVVDAAVGARTLGAPSAVDVFVTDAAAITGMTSEGVSQALAIPRSSSGFQIFEFPTRSVNGIASPINRTNPGFVGRGLTAGGAPEFVIPNGPLPSGTNRRIVP